MIRGVGRACGSPGAPALIRAACLLLVVAFTVASVRGETLTSRVVGAKPVASDSLIVGRAVCPSGVWLLNEHLDLIEIASRTMAVTVHVVTGFRRDERPWGLACVGGQTIWTLPDPRALARIDARGDVVDRRPIGGAVTALFGFGDRLLLAPAPPAVGLPLLTASSSDRLDDRRAWPGLLGRAAASRVDLLAYNLINCGIGTSQALPCWLADATEVVVSDGTHARRLRLPFVTAADVDREAPIRDVALVGNDRLWVLATSARLVNGRRAGGRLFLSSNGHDVARLDLPSGARLIVAASSSTCLLLTVDGHMLEVNAR